MTSTHKRMMLRPFALALVLAVTPIAFSGSTDSGVKISGVKINDACARGGGCCFEINSFCDERTLDYYRAIGGCPKL